MGDYLVYRPSRPTRAWGHSRRDICKEDEKPSSSVKIIEHHEVIEGGSAVERSHPFYRQICLTLDKLVSLACGVVVGTFRVVVGTSDSLCRFLGGGGPASLPGREPINMRRSAATANLGTVPFTKCVPLCLSFPYCSMHSL